MCSNDERIKNIMWFAGVFVFVSTLIHVFTAIHIIKAPKKIPPPWFEEKVERIEDRLDILIGEK